METRKVVGKRVYGADCVIGRKTRKPNTVSIEVDKRFILDAVDLINELEKGSAPETGLVGMELVAIYEDGKADEVIELEFDKEATVKSEEVPEVVAEEEKGEEE